MNLDDERTVVSTVPEAPPSADATVAFTPAEAPSAVDPGERTQMAVSATCPVCHTTNPPGETYCADCGFLLTGTPVEVAEEAAAPLARLVAGDGREFALNPGRNSVGRVNADVLLPDPSVSRSHAAITLEESRCSVEDPGSTNGTQVNGQRLAPNQPRDLRDGDEVAFGTVTLRVALPEGYVAAAPAAEAPRATVAHGAAVDSSPARFVDEESGAEYPLPVGAVAIGRRSANDIAFAADAYMSGRHAEVIFDGEMLMLTDIGSTNGTLVNDDRLAPNEPITLQDGDLVVMGQQRLRVRLEPTSAPDDEPDEEEAFAEAEGTGNEMPAGDDTTESAAC